MNQLEQTFTHIQHRCRNNAPRSPLFRASTKPGVANRSTKVAGKLKVLPEQPDSLPGFRTAVRAEPLKEQYDGVETVGESDEADVDEDDDEQDEGIEV